MRRQKWSQRTEGGRPDLAKVAAAGVAPADAVKRNVKCMLIPTGTLVILFQEGRGGSGAF